MSQRIGHRLGLDFCLSYDYARGYIVFAPSVSYFKFALKFYNEFGFIRLVRDIYEHLLAVSSKIINKYKCQNEIGFSFQNPKTLGLSFGVVKGKPCHIIEESHYFK